MSRPHKDRVGASDLARSLRQACPGQIRNLPDAKKVVDAFIGMLRQRALDHDMVTLPGFGTFQVFITRGSVIKSPLYPHSVRHVCPDYYTLRFRSSHTLRIKLNEHGVS